MSPEPWIAIYSPVAMPIIRLSVATSPAFGCVKTVRRGSEYRLNRA